MSESAPKPSSWDEMTKVIGDRIAAEFCQREANVTAAAERVVERMQGTEAYLDLTFNVPAAYVDERLKELAKEAVAGTVWSLHRTAESGYLTEQPQFWFEGSQPRAKSFTRPQREERGSRPAAGRRPSSCRPTTASRWRQPMSHAPAGPLLPRTAGWPVPPHARSRTVWTARRSADERLRHAVRPPAGPQVSSASSAFACSGAKTCTLCRPWCF